MTNPPQKISPCDRQSLHLTYLPVCREDTDILVLLLHKIDNLHFLSSFSAILKANKCGLITNLLRNIEHEMAFLKAL